MRTNIEKWSLLAFTRFVLALIVAVAHASDYTPLHWLSAVAVFGSFEAVLGFLLISGYSIGSSYGKEPVGFLKRRAWRIYPIYVAAIVLTCFAIPQTLNAKSFATLTQNLLFLNQVTTHTSFVGPAWTLALEAWLYCLTPWLWRLKPAHLRIGMYASFAMFCCYEFGRSAFDLRYYAGLSFGLNLPLLSFTWLAGFQLARDPSSRSIRDCGVIFLTHITLATAIQGVYRSRHGELSSLFATDLLEFMARGVTLAAVLLLFKWIVDGRTGRAPDMGMRLLGDISYPLYLTHAAVFIIAVGFGMRDAALLVSAALATSFLFYRGIDFYAQLYRSLKENRHVHEQAASELRGQPARE